jgi:alpha 1,2-mannosyltransferase
MLNLATAHPTWIFRAATSLLLAFGSLALLWRWDRQMSIGLYQAHGQSFDQALVLPDAQRQFWQVFYRDLTDTRPNCSRIAHNEGLNVVSLLEPPPPQPMKVQLEEDQHRALKSAHSAVVKRLHTRDYDLPYVPSSRGIVIIAGGSCLIHALVTVRMVRRTGTNLPIEVFLRDHSEGDPRICDAI